MGSDRWQINNPEYGITIKNHGEEKHLDIDDFYRLMEEKCATLKMKNTVILEIKEVLDKHKKGEKIIDSIDAKIKEAELAMQGVNYSLGYSLKKRVADLEMQLALMKK